MENLPDIFGDLASFSLANEIISNDNSATIDSLSIFKSEYINYIYGGLISLVIIIGLLAYKFNYVKRKPIENQYINEQINQQLNANYPFQ